MEYGVLFMDVITAIRTRRTIHKYTQKRVSRTVIDQCIEAAHQAPNHKLTWPWGFIVIGPKTRERLYQMALGMRQKAPGMSPQVEQRLREKLMNPGGMVIVTQTLCDDEFREREDYAATSCAIQNFMLAAQSFGYGTKWSTGALTRLPETYEIFDVNTTKDKIVGLIWMGEPAQVPKIERPALETVTRYLD